MDRSFASSILAVLLTGLLGTAMLLAGAPEARACLHPPPEITVAQSDQVGLIYHRDGRQDMLLSTGVEASGELPRLGWVVPVPAVPDRYGTADPKLFEEMAKWVDMRAYNLDVPRLSTGPASPNDEADEPDLKVLPTVQTGPFSITPLQASGKAGVEELVTWLKDNDFAVPKSTRPVDYFVERGWTFLAARVDPKQGEEVLSTDGRLPPLHLSFESERAVYPLKMETNQGEFSARIYVLTERPLPPEAFAGASERGFFVAGGPLPATDRIDGVRAEDATVAIPSVRSLVALQSHQRPGYFPMLEFRVRRFEVTRSRAPDTLVDALRETGAWQNDSPLYLRTLYAPQVNAGFAEPDEWREDLSIPPVPEGERLLGDGKVASPSSKIQTDEATPSEPESSSTGCTVSGRPAATPSVWVLSSLLMLGMVRRRA